MENLRNWQNSIKKYTKHWNLRTWQNSINKYTKHCEKYTELTKLNQKNYWTLWKKYGIDEIKVLRCFIRSCTAMRDSYDFLRFRWFRWLLTVFGRFFYRILLISLIFDSVCQIVYPRKYPIKYPTLAEPQNHQHS